VTGHAQPISDSKMAKVELRGASDAAGNFAKFIG
jgi:hypothetical protein